MASQVANFSFGRKFSAFERTTQIIPDNWLVTEIIRGDKIEEVVHFNKLMKIPKIFRNITARRAANFLNGRKISAFGRTPAPRATN